MTITLRHDAVFRKSMENPIVAKEIFNAHLPVEVKSLINTDTLKLEKESFVEKNLKAKISDVLFSVKTEAGDAYLYLLLEHQSSPDHWMALRLFRYMINICDRYRTLNKKATQLPLIYPMIFYNGTEEYNAPRGF